MSQYAHRNVIESVDREGLLAAAAKGGADPAAIRTLKSHTVLERKFRHLNHIRDLPVHVLDEPVAVLGEDTGPNPAEAVLAALGSCLSVGIHANAVVRRIPIRRLEVLLEGDINISAIWGIGDLSDKHLGFSAIRARVILEGDASREELAEIVAHADRWSPLTNTVRQPVPLRVVLD